MKELNEELGKIRNGTTLANHPGWTGGNPFLFYTETENACCMTDKKDGFVTVCINGKTGAVNICMKIKEVREVPFSYPRQGKDRNLLLPILEEVTGTIVSVNYVDNCQEHDYFSDDHKLIGRFCVAYRVDSEVSEKAEGLDLLYNNAPVAEESEIEAIFDRQCQYEANMKKLWEMGYYGDFVILGALDD